MQLLRIPIKEERFDLFRSAGGTNDKLGTSANVNSAMQTQHGHVATPVDLLVMDLECRVPA